MTTPQRRGTRLHLAAKGTVAQASIPASPSFERRQSRDVFANVAKHHSVSRTTLASSDEDTTTCPPSPVPERPIPVIKDKLVNSESTMTYVGEDPVTGQEVLAKVLPKPWSTENYDPLLELAITSLVQPHPNIARLVSVSPPESDLVLSLELANQGNLQAYLVQHNHQLPLALAQQCIVHIVQAVAHIHSLGVAWRDISPENVLLNQSKDKMNFMIDNFSLAEHFTEAAHALTDRCGGTKEYLAPEVLRSIVWETAFNPFEADIWSLGVLFHQLLFGTIPQYQKRLLAGSSNLFGVRVSRRANPFARDLVKKMLVPNPAKRLTISDALSHPFITRLGNHI